MITLPLILLSTGCATDKVVNKVTAANIATASNKQLQEQVKTADSRRQTAIQAVKPNPKCDAQYRSGKQSGDTYGVLVKKLDLALTNANAHILRCYRDQYSKYQRLTGG